MLRTSILSLILPLLLSACGPTNKKTIQADIVIYGGTSAGVIAAVQAARMDHTVVLISPTEHLGGLSSSGLGFTDSGNKAVIGGLSREFYERIYSYYQNPDTWKWQSREDYGNRGQGTPAMDGAHKTMWIFEPHIAESVFEDLIDEYSIQVYRNEKLDRERGVVTENGRIESITTLNGLTFQGACFIDATYEGDLMAASDVSYAIGREANRVYNENWNGVQKNIRYQHHQFGDLKIDPYVIPGDPTSGIIPRVSADDPGINGEGDHRVQAYCYRTCLTKVKANQVPFPRPVDYDSTQYEVLVRLFEAGYRDIFRKYDPIPNAKTDVNNYGPFSFDNIGMNYNYPEASYDEREAIIREHTTYQQGLLYFLAHDPRVPEEIQEEMNQWGLAQDEFTDNNHWPWQLYIREARRMMGTFVMTENEIFHRQPVDEPIGMGSYTMDSHNTQRYITPEGYIQNEGDVEVPTQKPYPIALGSILPKQDECKNLLVPVALSSSHIAYGSIRMEPVFMILGQSAATLACLALETQTDLHALDYAILRNQLLMDGQVLEL